MCGICVAEVGYTMEQVLTGASKRDILVPRIKQHYRMSMLASLEKRQQRGRKVRAALGIEEPEDLVDIEALKLKDDPFPNFKPRHALLRF